MIIILRTSAHYASFVHICSFDYVYLAVKDHEPRWSDLIHELGNHRYGPKQVNSTFASPAWCLKQEKKLLICVFNLCTELGM